MTLNCRTVQQSLRCFHEEENPGDTAVEEHLRHCAKCRCAARQQGLTRLLKTAALAPLPEPSNFFMTRLRGALEDCAAPRPIATMADLLAKSGLRLAPALAALVMLISISSACFVAPLDNVSTSVSAEELLLDDHPLSADLVLAAITGEEIER